MERETTYMVKVSIDGLIAIVFAFGLYIKEFYIMASGSLQLGDIILVATFGICLLSRKIQIQRIDSPLFAFLIMAIIINFFYYLWSSDSSFLKYSSYLIFSLAIVLLSRSILYNDCALDYSSFALKSALITQIVIRFIGRGRYFFGRYSGSFNDPNQFGYYVLMCIFIIYVISFLRCKKLHIVWIVLSGYLIILSQSSGMFVGFAVFLTFFIWRLTGNQPNNLKYALRVAVILLLFVSLLMLFSIGDLAMLSTYNGRFSGLRRLLKRISSGNSLKEFAKFYIKDRSLTRVVENPFGFIYGTGEGMWTRYTTRNEIHATMISLCFYYGIIPYSCWIIWLRSNMKSLHPALLCVYVAQIAEAFTLANHRQPFFWIMFVLASSIYAKKDAADLYKKSNIDDPIDNCILR